MASYSDIFGTGAMPTFNIAQGQGNRNWQYGGDESAAMMQDHLDQRAREYAEQKEFFQDTTMPALKAMFNPDEPEKDPLEAYLDEEAAALAAEEAAAEEAREGLALDRHAAAVEAMTDDHAYRGGYDYDVVPGGVGNKAITGGATGLIAGPIGGILGAAAGVSAQGYEDMINNMLEERQPGGALDPEKFKKEEDDTWWDRLMKSLNLGMTSGAMQGQAFEDGGRVGMNTGGYLPWTQTMSSDYANQYYNQFNDPTFGATTATQATTPTQSDTPTDLGDLGTIIPTTVPLSGGLAQQRGRGPEDRMEGFRPQDNPLSFSHPDNQTSMTFEDGKLVYDNVNPYLETGVVSGDEVPIVSPILAGIGWLKDKIEGWGDEKDDAQEFAEETLQKGIEQRELEERAAQEKKAEENRLAKEAEEARQQLAELAALANQGNDPKPQTPSYSTGTWQTGGGGGNYGHHGGFGGPSGHGSGKQKGKHGAGGFSHGPDGKNW